MKKIIYVYTLLLLVSCSSTKIQAVQKPKSLLETRRSNIISCIKGFISLEVNPLDSSIICKETYSTKR